MDDPADREYSRAPELEDVVGLCRSLNRESVRYLLIGGWAVILHGAALKLLVFAVLLAEAVLPVGRLPPAAAAGSLAGAVLVVAVGIGLMESLLARLAFRRVPMLLTTAFLLCLFALLAAWKGVGV